MALFSQEYNLGTIPRLHSPCFSTGTFNSDLDFGFGLVISMLWFVLRYVSTGTY
jgi:hypothetical protein